MRKGKRVAQGEVIGYVGATGLATGPHLHYEFRINGVHQNPLRVAMRLGGHSCHVLVVQQKTEVRAGATGSVRPAARSFARYQSRD